MRKVILLAGITLDGHIARPDDSIDYLEMTKEGGRDLAALFASADTIVMGAGIFGTPDPAATMRRVRELCAS